MKYHLLEEEKLSPYGLGFHFLFVCYSMLLFFYFILLVVIVYSSVYYEVVLC
jgi:hypothetical protein